MEMGLERVVATGGRQRAASLPLSSCDSALEPKGRRSPGDLRPSRARRCFSVEVQPPFPHLMLAFLARAPRPLLSGSAGSPRRAMAAAARQGLRSSSSSSKKLVECFYDVLSPYSWLGFEVLCRYRPIWNMELRFRPVFLGGIMHSTGNRPPALVPKKGEYMTKDLLRMAKFYQVPLHLVKDFLGSVLEKGSLKAMRFVTAVDMAEPQFLEPVSRELWMRIWSRVSMVVLVRLSRCFCACRDYFFYLLIAQIKQGIPAPAPAPPPRLSKYMLLIK
uniref:Glutathione S-transferase kappa 1 n=1 Tax=Podarcis muralis TaxID=64176 RepID=A0A670K1D3_PODMU